MKLSVREPVSEESVRAARISALAYRHHRGEKRRKRGRAGWQPASPLCRCEAHYVRTESALTGKEREKKKKGGPDRAVPMLPEARRNGNVLAQAPGERLVRERKGKRGMEAGVFAPRSV